MRTSVFCWEYFSMWSFFLHNRNEDEYIFFITVMRTILVLLNYGDANYLFVHYGDEMRISVYCGNKNENIFPYCNVMRRRIFLFVTVMKTFLHYSNVNVWKVFYCHEYNVTMQIHAFVSEALQVSQSKHFKCLSSADDVTSWRVLGGVSPLLSTNQRRPNVMTSSSGSDCVDGVFLSFGD